MTDNDILEQVGRALYGDRWQSSLARDLNLSDRAMRRYAAGERDVGNLHVLPTLLIEIRKRRAKLSDLEKIIEKRLGKVTP